MDSIVFINECEQGCQPSQIIWETPDFGPNLMVSRFSVQNLLRENKMVEIVTIAHDLKIANGQG